MTSFFARKSPSIEEHETPDPAAQPRPEFVALIFHLHPYDPTALIGAMLQQRIAATDRPFDENAARLVTALTPAVVVLVSDGGDHGSIEAVEAIRRATSAFILLVVGHAMSAVDVARALDAGADAFVREGEPPGITAAVLGAITRRLAREAPQPHPALELAGFRVYEQRREAWYGDHLIPLTGMEFRVFATLAASPGRVISPVAILAAAGIDAPDESAAAQVKVYILRVRRKLAEVAPGKEYIHTVRGMGYMFERRQSHDALDATTDHDS